MKIKTKDYNFLDENITLSCQSTEHTISLIQEEITTYKSLFKIDFQPNDVILDLGANIGIISILLSKKFPFTKIYSYEASPINFENFKLNITQNKCENITPFNFAVWSTSGDTLQIPTSPTNSGGSSVYYKQEFFERYPVANVNTISLEDIFKEHGIESCKLLKIDVEGSEYEIFSKFPVERLNQIKNVGIEFHKCAASKLVDIKKMFNENGVKIVCEFNAEGGKLKQ
jgi:FkbM family methyltransferase